ncbi:hydroxymethylglutaryl-CoA lyase [Bosea psychrotolerans]|uniref:Hydroxymethylglutaryl-CoA lyase n=1 Tax=Bosea psychrotolerans TaxID=1871628 RepID=A0A2S4MBF5_9HYPH|nr:hydroxymethylglutaryl-CoA lyase [Bosea psychrotolerans]POR51949.1 hydroxymethylglutaryl-CoA lyase [Bosea psychrotolerans]
MQNIDIVEVAPRDGLQNEGRTFATDDKVRLCELLLRAGVRRMEVSSFVNPRLVPQMADAEALFARIPQRLDAELIGLVLNRRGFERALLAGVRSINVVVLASESFSRRNQGSTIADSLAVSRELSDEARRAGIRYSVTIGAAFGCPFEGLVPQGRVLEIAGRLAADGLDELTLADTIGVADPGAVEAFAVALEREAPGVRLRGHFHNTRNIGLANAYAAVRSGFSGLDSSLGGIGGCPFAPAATGNIPTEDLWYMLERMGIATGLDGEALIAASSWLADRLGKPVPAMLGRAGLFPPKPGVPPGLV